MEIIKKYGFTLAALTYVRRECLEVIAPLGATVYAVWQTVGRGAMAYGDFVVINSIGTIAYALLNFSDGLLKSQDNALYIENLREFLEYEPGMTDGEKEIPEKGDLVLEHVSFRYEGASEYALRDITMRLGQKEKIAIVGHNGAGKTTLTKLLMHLYEPTAGEILYNGVPIHTYETATLRGRLSAVFQNHRIFAATVAENVAGGCYTPDREGDVREALHKSIFTEKLASLPCGLYTVLTREFDPSGTQLSGGEMQKIAIARAFYKNADLIILDEPSSALDPDAEYALNRDIASYAAGKTIVFISHRLSTTRHADRIYMFDGGRVIESGTHEELMRMEGKYAYMFNLQAKEYRKTQGINA